MSDPRCWKGEACQQSRKGLPAHAPRFLTAPSQASQPDAEHFLTERGERREVLWSAIIAVMTEQNAGVPAMLHGQRHMHQLPRLLAQRLQLSR